MYIKNAYKRVKISLSKRVKFYKNHSRKGETLQKNEILLFEGVKWGTTNLWIVPHLSPWKSGISFILGWFSLFLEWFSKWKPTFHSFRSGLQNFTLKSEVSLFYI